jgi:hypothetical protein
MRRYAVPVAGLFLWAACAGPAAAQDGAGLYEPFPEPAGPEVSRDFVGALPAPGRSLAANLAASDIERGIRVSPDDLPAGFALPATAAAGAGERAEPESVLGSTLSWTLASALVALVCTGALRLARR